MWRIDYWLGLLLCFLLTGMNYILSLLSLRRKEKVSHQKILFIKLSEMGSIVLAYPLMNKAKSECPKAEIFFLTFEKNRPLFEILGIIPDNNILTISEDSIYLFVLDTLNPSSTLSR